MRLLVPQDQYITNLELKQCLMSVFGNLEGFKELREGSIKQISGESQEFAVFSNHHTLKSSQTY